MLYLWYEGVVDCKAIILISYSKQPSLLLNGEVVIWQATDSPLNAFNQRLKVDGQMKTLLKDDELTSKQ